MSVYKYSDGELEKENQQHINELYNKNSDTRLKAVETLEKLGWEKVYDC